MTKQTRRRRSKKRRPDFFQKYKAALLLMGVAGLAVLALVSLARLSEQPQTPELAPVEKPQVDDTARIHDEVESFLATLEVDEKAIRRELDETPARYTVAAGYPSEEVIETFALQIKAMPGIYSLDIQDVNTLTVRKSGRAQITMLFMPPVPEPPTGPLMTIIMDDLGRSTNVAEVLTSLAEPVTFSILPGEAHAVEVAEIAYAAGHEVMLHVPMEPQGFPAVDPGSDALFVKYRNDEIRARFDHFLTKVPHVTGANNHMGSRFTEDARALLPVMEVMQEKGLFFVDSRTTGQSKVTEVANRFGVPTMSRDVFLDNVAEVDAIVREINRLESRARRQGQAIGICHPYPETLEALRRELPKMNDLGIAVVPVSILLQRQAQSQGS